MKFDLCDELAPEALGTAETGSRLLDKIDGADRHGHRPALMLNEGEANRLCNGLQHPLHGLAMLRPDRAVGDEGLDPGRARRVGNDHRGIGLEALVERTDLQQATFDRAVAPVGQEGRDFLRRQRRQPPSRNQPAIAIGCLKSSNIS